MKADLKEKEIVVDAHKSYERGWVAHIRCKHKSAKKKKFVKKIFMSCARHKFFNGEVLADLFFLREYTRLSIN